MSSRRQIMIYDDQCPMCTFQVKSLTWLDWFNALRFLPMSNPEVQERAPQLQREDLMAAMHCLATNGRIYKGARAIRHAAIRIPLLIPLALIMWIPGIIFIAERVYQWISTNRYILSKLFGCGDACQIMPARKREDESITGPSPDKG